jgi:hypothetical protein
MMTPMLLPILPDEPFPDYPERPITQGEFTSAVMFAMGKFIAIMAPVKSHEHFCAKVHSDLLHLRREVGELYLKMKEAGL